MLVPLPPPKLTGKYVGELPPAYAGGLHEFQLMLSGVFSALLFDVSANDFLVHSDCGYEVTV